MNPIKHIAIIMDGNGRWGIQNKGSRNLGHKAGVSTIEKIIEQTIEYKIKYLTLYTFSTENWKRPQKEIFFLFNLLEVFLQKRLDALIKNGIKLKIIGNKKRFSKKLQNIISNAEKKTSNNDILQINLALNYGAKDEIIQSIKKLNKTSKRITEKNVDDNLFTKGLPNPDLLIRTGDTRRLSNFLLWQIAYTEIFFEKKLWPDFKKSDYIRIINKFKLLKRNFGAI